MLIIYKEKLYSVIEQIDAVEIGDELENWDSEIEEFCNKDTEVRAIRDQVEDIK